MATEERQPMTSAPEDSEELPRIVVTKITPQLLTLWNKELERLHKMLKEAPDDATKEWSKSQITRLHKMVFGNGSDSD